MVKTECVVAVVCVASDPHHGGSSVTDCSKKQMHEKDNINQDLKCKKKTHKHSLKQDTVQSDRTNQHSKHKGETEPVTNWQEAADTFHGAPPKKKHKPHRTDEAAQPTFQTEDSKQTLPEAASSELSKQKKKKHKKKLKSNAGSVQTDNKHDKHRARKLPVITDDRLLAYGINPKKFKYGYKNKLKQEAV